MNQTFAGYVSSGCNDYSSSSTYHIYDQIDDLIIIKQQRLERKRQVKRRRQIISLIIFVSILVSLSVYLLFQLLFAQNSNNSKLSSSPQNSNSPTIHFTSPRYQPQPQPNWLDPNSPQICSYATCNAAGGYCNSNVCTCFPNFFGPNCQYQIPPNAGRLSPILPVSQSQQTPIQIPPSQSQIPQQASIQKPKLQDPPPRQQDFSSKQQNDTNKLETSAVIVNSPIDGAISLPPHHHHTLNANHQLLHNKHHPQVPKQQQSEIVRFQIKTQPTPVRVSARNKTIPCPNCNGNGVCQQDVGKCKCFAGFSGDNCNLVAEKICDDNLDNDNDGLVDCADSECCSDKACSNSPICYKSQDPLDILNRRQPTPPSASFFQRMKFLIEKLSSHQAYRTKDFNESRASVIRGRVVYKKQGLIGVRVSVAGQPDFGVTFTRDGGYFDLLVNGGGIIVLELRREPFVNIEKRIRVPWNEITLVDPIEMSLVSQPVDSTSTTNNPVCSAHDYRIMRPQIITNQASFHKTKSPYSASILRDSGVVRQSIQLPGQSDVSLLYTSSKANEYMSTINVQLTPPATIETDNKLSEELKLLHLKITIEGILFERIFPVQANFSYSYAWNRRNVYRQKCFGQSTAIVSVGYEYFDCEQIVWTTKQIQLAGHDLSISDVGSQWNFNIHHRYNYRDSILQRGDGQNFNLKADKPKIVQSIMGDGYQRQAICPYCDGAASSIDQRLFKPQSLVAAPDGSLYVGDFNLIRRIEEPTSGNHKQNERIVRTVLELPTSRVSNRYYLALSSSANQQQSGKLYLADPDKSQIFLIKQQQQQDSSNYSDNVTSGSSDTDNLIPVVGSGVVCRLGTDSTGTCGDGQLAHNSRLIEPKAVAFDLADKMYIADGPNIRMVDPNDNKIYSILGDFGETRDVKFPCNDGEAIPMHKFAPKNPLDLAVNPIDDTLHILDDNVVYKVTKDKRVLVVAGRLAHCVDDRLASSSKAAAPLKATDVFLQSAQSIAFGPNGDLFISEDDQRVLLVSHENDAISIQAGLPSETVVSKPTTTTTTTADLLSASPTNQQDKNRSSNVLPKSQATRALDYKFGSIAAIAVDQQGKLIIADRLQLKLLSVEPDLPQMNTADEYEIQSPDEPDEVLVFNRHGHHIATRDSRNVNKYTFSYNVQTSFGQLSSISLTAGGGFKIDLYREGPNHNVKMIDTSRADQFKLDISRSGQVHAISSSNTPMKAAFSYLGDGGLLKSSQNQATRDLFEFHYDEFGRATGINYSSPKRGPIECQLQASSSYEDLCSSLIVAG